MYRAAAQQRPAAGEPMRLLSTVACAFVALFTAPGQDAGGARAEVVIRNVSVLSPDGESWLNGRDVIIRGTRVATVQPTGGPVPAAKHAIDGTGKFAIPGLFDTHVHMARLTPEAAGVFVAFGVTSVRDMGTDPEKIVAWRRAIARGTFMGPRIVQACGPMLEGRGEPRVDHWLVANPQAAAGIVEKLRVLGMDCVKVRTFADAETLRAIGAAASARGMMLAGHPPEPLTTAEAVALGMRSFEHAFFPYPLSKVAAADRDAAIRGLVAAGAAHVPTLIAWYPSTIEADELRKALAAIELSASYGLPDALLTHWKNFVPEHERQKRGTPGWQSALRTAAADIGTLHRAGVRVLPGSDTGAPFVTPGLGLHDELALLVSMAGLTPAQALRAATIESARFLGCDGDLGSIEQGKIADLVILTGDPLADIRETRSIDAVVFRGEALTMAHRNQLLARSR
jgi:imidazolonepropionase-like amidohydrolase